MALNVHVDFTCFAVSLCPTENTILSKGQVCALSKHVGPLKHWVVIVAFSGSPNFRQSAINTTDDSVIFGFAPERAWVNDLFAALWQWAFSPNCKLLDDLDFATIGKVVREAFEALGISSFI